MYLGESASAKHLLPLIYWTCCGPLKRDNNTGFLCYVAVSHGCAAFVLEEMYKFAKSHFEAGAKRRKGHNSQLCKRIVHTRNIELQRKLKKISRRTPRCAKIENFHGEHGIVFLK